MSASRVKDTATTLWGDFIVCRKMRQTPERLAILNGALEMPAHFSPADIARSLDKAGTRYSLTTVYTTLNLLVEAKILRRVTFDDRAALYERAPLLGGNSRTRKPHHHLVCTSCGRISETREPDLPLDTIKTSIGKNAAGFEPAEISLTVYGLCARCVRQAARRSVHHHENKS